MSLIGTCSDCGTGGVSLRYKPSVPVNEQSRPSICDRCRDFREEQATHYVPCEKCGDRLPSERAHSLDVTAEDEYYPEFIHFCPSCRPEANDDDGELVTDGGQPAEDGQGDKHETPMDGDTVAAMNEYRDLVEAAGVARENALDLHDRVQGLQWVAAGGLGTGSTEKVKELAEALQKNAETLAELAEEAPDAREVRDRDE